MKITSAQNPLIKQFEKISKQKKARQETRLTVLDGLHLIQAYLEFNADFEALLVTSDFCAKNEVIKRFDYHEIPETLMRKIAPTKNPSGILALIKTPPLSPSNHTPKKAILLDHLQDPGNMGTIIRSAVAAGFEVLYSYNSVEIWSPKTLRAAQGAHFYPLSLQVVNNLNDLPRLTWYSLSCDETSTDYSTIKYTSPFGFIVGNEGQGLSETIKTLNPTSIHIPMHHDFESLNAGVAASICLFHTINASDQLPAQ